MNCQKLLDATPRRRMLLAAMIACFALGCVAAGAQTLPVTYKNSTYVLTYTPAEKKLECASDNTDCVWRVEVSRQIGAFRDIAAVATAAGPVIVYSEGNQTLFALLHFRSGSTTVEGGGESLKGSIGQGWMLNCLMQAEQYGAKVICQTVAGTTIREYNHDINIGGQHKLIEANPNAGTFAQGQAPRSQKLVDTERKFSCDLPRGFRSTPTDANTIALYGLSTDVYMAIFSDAGATPINELGDAYMAEQGVTVTQRSNESLDDGTPALLLIGNGNVEGVESARVGLFFSTNNRTYVVAYNAPKAVGAAYLMGFKEVLESFKPLN